MTACSPEYQLIRYEKLRYVSMGVHRITRSQTHEHGVLELGLVLSGSIRVEQESGSRLVEAGQSMLFNAYEPHTLSAAAPATVLHLWISGHFGREYFSNLDKVTFDAGALAQLPQQTALQLRQLMLAAADSYFRENQGYQLECVGHVDLLLTLLLRSLPHTRDTDARATVRQKNMSRKRRIAGYIEEHYKKKLSLSALARDEGLTAAYMSRVFRELFGMSFQEYLNLLRLERALPLLRDPSVYLLDVCMECGFSDTRYLNSVCRQVFGCSAAQYRQQYAGQNPPPAQPHAEEYRYTDRESLELVNKFLRMESFSK